MEYLKSNMDRFIVDCITFVYVHSDLKSNMDRFIGHLSKAFLNNQSHLKSNMDRFIAYGVIICCVNTII